MGSHRLTLITISSLTTGTMAMTMADVTVAIAASLASGGVCVAADLFQPPPAPVHAPTLVPVPPPPAAAVVAAADRAPSLEPKQLLAWQALFDMMKMKRTTTPSSSTAGHVDTAAANGGGDGGGGCEGIWLSRDDPCSCSDLWYVRCSDDGTALTYLDIGQCHVTGKQQHTKVATVRQTHM